MVLNDRSVDLQINFLTCVCLKKIRDYHPDCVLSCRRTTVKQPSIKMSKLSFRARALDPSKPLNIHVAEELPDLTEYSAINRAVPQMPSGMEKEEESVSFHKQILGGHFYLYAIDTTVFIHSRKRGDAILAATRNNEEKKFFFFW